MSLTEIARDPRNNPLDVVERMAAGNNWPFERAGEDEIGLVVTGRWTNYQASFTWMSDIEALHLACAFDMKVPDGRLTDVQKLIALINEQLWIGHFDVLDADRRHHVPPRAGAGRRRRRIGPAMRGGVRHRAGFLRALLPGVSIRDLGRQVGARGDGLRHVRDRGRGVSGGLADLRDFSGLTVLVGAGKMGGALLEGWLRLGLDAKKVAVLEPQPSPEILALAGRGLLRLNPDPQTLGNAAAIVIAVKPQAAGEAIAALPPLVAASTVVVSIMAGRTLQFLAGALARPCALVRAMPNTPAAIGRGITVAVPRNADAAQRETADRLLRATGAVEWIDDEALMDAVTAVSGSGPAYVFLLAEVLAQAGAAAGLPPPLAQKLARETVAGAGELLHRSALDAAALRENVTSPGGTTAAALAVLMGENGLAALLNRAVAAATARSRQLAD